MRTISGRTLCSAVRSAYVNPVPFTLNTQPLKNTDGTDYTKTLLIGKKGDTNLDGKVDVEDAVLVLQYYAKKAAGLESTLLEQATNEEEILSYFLSDIDTCSQNQGTDGGELSVEDAVQILTYYAQLLPETIRFGATANTKQSYENRDTVFLLSPIC